MVGKKKGAATKRKANKASNGPENPFHKAFYDDSSSDDNGNFNLNAQGELLRKAGRKPKRPRVAGPEPVLESDVECEGKGHGMTMDLDGGKFAKLLLGLDGPQLSVNLADILSNSRIDINELLHNAGLQLVRTNGCVLKSPSKYRGFVDLPYDVAIDIYRHLFVTNAPIMFSRRDSFSRSSQFLRVCSKAHNEGTAILYGENAFHLSRVHQSRGKYFESHWAEIGYKDVRRFLNDIGPKNVASLKYISIEFEDALPSLTNMRFSERRYVNDAVLLEVLGKLASHATLNKFIIGFRGNRGLTERDYHLLNVLANIKCFELSSSRHGTHRVNAEILVSLKHLMVLPAKIDVDLSRVSIVPQMYGQPKDGDE